MGPRELFYADIFASRRTGCRSTLGMPGVRDQHSGCVGVYLVEHDLFDFLLLSLPDNDRHSHKHGPDAQVCGRSRRRTASSRALLDAAGGVERLPGRARRDRRWPTTRRRWSSARSRCSDAARGLDVLARPPTGAAGSRRRRSRSARRSAPRWSTCSAERRREGLRSDVVRAALRIDGVELVMWLERERTASRPRVRSRGRRSASCASRRAARSRTRAAASWRLTGSSRCSGASVRDGRPGRRPSTPTRSRASGLRSPARHPARSCCRRPRAGEFSDWGGAAHVGGGSHGSLRAEDSLGAADSVRRRAPARARRAVVDPRRRAARPRSLRTDVMPPRCGAALAALPIAVALLLASASSAAAALPAHLGARAARTAKTATERATNPESPVPVAPSDTPPVGRRLSANQILEIANRLAKMRRVRAGYPGSYGGAYLKGPTRWQVSYFSRKGKEIGQVIIADADGQGAGTVDRLPDRLDDGARLPRGVRQARQRAVHLAAAVRAVRAAVLRLAPAAAAAAPRPARAARRSRCRSRSSTTPTSTPRCR